MKKIITTVGTSIFSNYYEWKSEKQESGEAKADFNTLRKKPHDDWGYYMDEEIEKLRKIISSWATSKDQASAEISSLLKIVEQYTGEDLEVYLIATDTVLSRLAAELVKEWFGEKIIIHFDPNQHVISGLSIEQAGTFIEQGIQGLVQTILNIKGEDESSMLLNISGGYKGLIPVMTIVGQLYDMNICYTYEDSEELIEIPRMPLNFDWEIIEQYSTALLRPQRMTPQDGEALTVLHLATAQNEGFTLTLLGKLIAQYLDRNPPHFGTQFGYFIEYKLKEYFDEQLGCQQVLHGYKPGKQDNTAPQGDVDLALLDGSGGFTAIEIKPFELLSNLEVLERFMKKLTDRAISLGAQQKLAPRELWLFTYSFQEERGKKVVPVLDANQTSALTQIAIQMRLAIPAVNFVCKHVLVTRNKVTHGDRIPYKKFMEGSIKEEQIATIFSTK